MKALIFGATGLTGNYLTDILLADPTYSEVVLFVRKNTGKSHPKLREIVLSYDELDTYADEIKGDVIFNCLGTTLKVAGSQAAQQKIDRDYPIHIAKIGAQNGIKKMMSVSAVGANAQSSVFYSRTKGEMEQGIIQAIGAGAHMFRPSFLLGDRKEFRLGEKIGIAFSGILDIFMIGPASMYHSIHAQKVALSMANAAKSTQSLPQILHYTDMSWLC